MEQMELPMETIKAQYSEETELLQVIIITLMQRLGLKEMTFTEEEMNAPMAAFGTLSVLLSPKQPITVMLESSTEAKIIQ